MSLFQQPIKMQNTSTKIVKIVRRIENRL